MRGVPDNAYHREVEGRHGNTLDVRVSLANDGMVRVASVQGINGGVWLDLDAAEAARDALDEAIIVAKATLTRQEA
jgi:hypothetical protein